MWSLSCDCEQTEGHTEKLTTTLRTPSRGEVILHVLRKDENDRARNVGLWTVAD